jgi:hypothetical protein
MTILYVKGGALQGWRVTRVGDLMVLQTALAFAREAMTFSQLLYW